MTDVDPRFPQAIAEIWRVLKSEVVWLHGRWIMYRQLFGTSQDRIAVLNRSASTFFNVLSKTLLHDVQLSLGKLGDPARTGGHRNLSLRALHESLVEAGEGTSAARLDPLVELFDHACSKLRRRRNKWIAHFDLTTMLNSAVAPLEGPSRLEIEQALAALREAMNSVELHYTETQTAYELFSMTHDGDSLISTLMQGLRYRELVIEKAIPHDDLRKNFSHGA